jgi:hypothetical protein
MSHSSGCVGIAFEASSPVIRCAPAAPMLLPVSARNHRRHIEHGLFRASGMVSFYRHH